MPFTNLQKANCAARELMQRERVYPRLIRTKRMSERVATEQIAIMTEIEAEYRAKAVAAGETVPKQGALSL